MKGRAYHDETDFNSAAAELRFGAALNSGPNQWRATGQYLQFDQEGDAPGDPKPTNDRRMGGWGSTGATRSTPSARSGSACS